MTSLLFDLLYGYCFNSLVRVKKLNSDDEENRKTKRVSSFPTVYSLAIQQRAACCQTGWYRCRWNATVLLLGD